MEYVLVMHFIKKISILDIKINLEKHCVNVPINDKKIGIVNYNTGNVGSLTRR